MGPSLESLAHTLNITGFTIKFGDVDLVVNAPLLFILPSSGRGTGYPHGATSCLGAAVTSLTLRTLLLLLPLLPCLRVFFLGVTASVVAPSSSDV